MKFGESLIKYEALTTTPLREEFGSINIDKQIEMLDGLIIKVRQYAETNNLPHPNKKTWAAFKKTANWTQVAKLAILEYNKQNSYVGKIKKKLFNSSK